MTPYKYEVLFYENKRFTGITTFDNIKEAADHLIACIDRYMEAEGFYTNVDSSYCISVFDLSSSERMIQLLGPLHDEDKYYIQQKLDALNMKWARNIIHN